MLVLYAMVVSQTGKEGVYGFRYGVVGDSAELFFFGGVVIKEKPGQEGRTTLLAGPLLLCSSDKALCAVLEVALKLRVDENQVGFGVVSFSLRVLAGEGKGCRQKIKRTSRIG